MKDHKIIKVKIINGSGWYQDFVGNWFIVKEFNDPTVICYHLPNPNAGIIMKEDALTLKQLREEKLNRILHE